MSKIFIITFLVAIFCSCSQKINTSKTDGEKFNIKAFESRQSDHQLLTKFKDGSWVRQFESSKQFIEERGKDIDSPFSEYRVFEEKGNVKISGKEFDGFQIGLWTEFNNNGKLIKTTNFDKDYPFSIYDLDQMMKKKFKVDIMHRDQYVLVAREYNNNVYCYMVRIPLAGIAKGDHRRLQINGSNGEVMSDSVIPYLE